MPQGREVRGRPAPGFPPVRRRRTDTNTRRGSAGQPPACSAARGGGFHRGRGAAPPHGRPPTEGSVAENTFRGLCRTPVKTSWPHIFNVKLTSSEAFVEVQAECFLTPSIQ